jgi:hypothetical protein
VSLPRRYIETVVLLFFRSCKFSRGTCLPSLPSNELFWLSGVMSQYCGVLTPCKSCNIETRSHEYATVDEAVFSPCWAVPWRVAHRVASHRLASPRLLPVDSYKHLDDARVGRVTWPRQQWRYAFQQWRNNWSVSRVSDQGFIGETETRLRVSPRWETTVEVS